MESVVRGGPWWPGQDRDAAVLAAFGMLLHCTLALQPHPGGYRCPALATQPRCGPASLQRGEVASSHPSTMAGRCLQGFWPQRDQQLHPWEGLS